ncbi:hypothetical protein CRG98_030139 [Punica granatum]|uniref:Uncharacterized protein n=1 Tax=Punica granatum TaxID=22663 RepID=A0A2I0IZW1_PUNGR|nr:hypothetical protein CRG98_030139 [Punica granatum]
MAELMGKSGLIHGKADRQLGHPLQCSRRNSSISRSQSNTSTRGTHGPEEEHRWRWIFSLSPANPKARPLNAVAIGRTPRALTPAHLSQRGFRGQRSLSKRKNFELIPLGPGKTNQRKVSICSQCGIIPQDMDIDVVLRAHAPHPG